jgi:hypothetical protein
MCDGTGKHDKWLIYNYLGMAKGYCRCGKNGFEVQIGTAPKLNRETALLWESRPGKTLGILLVWTSFLDGLGRAEARPRLSAYI